MIYKGLFVMEISSEDISAEPMKEAGFIFNDYFLKLIFKIGNEE